MGKTLRSRTGVVIPVYNEATVLEQTIKEVTTYFDFVICVNDGSSDESGKIIRGSSAYLVEHAVNLGMGAAIQTGIEFALTYPDIHYIASFDADGQHDIKDLVHMVEVLQTEKLDMVIGSRFIGSAKNIPFIKKLLLKYAIRFTNHFSGIDLTDTHNGLRVFTRKVAEELDITLPDMAHASEIIDKISQAKWRYKEVPVTIHYTEYSRQKGQSVFNAINILFDLILNRRRYHK